MSVCDNSIVTLFKVMVSSFDRLFTYRLLTLAAWSIFLLPASADPPDTSLAQWGSDHVGEKFPEYITGDECLFCHRRVGTNWSVNPHQRTTRQATPDDSAIHLLGESNDQLAFETQLLIGSRRITRFLRRAKEYGKLEILTSAYVPARTDDPESEELVRNESMHWSPHTFADRCAGCHTTAVDAATRSFSTLSLDCVTCHGEVELEHTGDVSRVLLSAENQDPRTVMSICGQCHLRGGKSKSSGLPYPNTFVAGDNLFRDFDVDLSNDVINKLPLIEQHIYLNARTVIATDQNTMTCVTCHDVHRVSSEQHQSLRDTAICGSCHAPDTDNSELSQPLKLESELRTTNKTCDY